MEEDEPITHKMITRSIEKAQKKVEGHNFEIRKYVLEYDDVMNQQREVLYSQRRQVLTAESLRESILGMVDDIIQSGLDKYADEKLYPEEWDFAGLLQQMEQYFVPKGATTVAELENLSRLEVQDKLKKIATDLYNEREAEIGEDTMHQLEKAVMLRVVDSKWMDHLDAMDALKEGINLRAYGQKNPLVEYKFEAYEMFEEMVDSIKHTVVTFLYHIQITYSKPVPQAEDHLKSATEVHQEMQPVSREDIERDERKHD
jgi:preprotein translocase subunit SecA